MRSDEEFLLDISESTGAILDFIAGLSFDDFLRDRMIRSAVMFEFLVIGEPCAKLSAELRDRYDDVPWNEIIGFRHVIAHGYFGLNWERAWRTATVDVPDLRTRIPEILSAEFSDS
jgi:uncharacterized protein with HEPN domain